MRSQISLLSQGAIGALSLVLTTFAISDDVYQDPAAFLRATFSGEVPPPKVIWLIGAIKKDVETILGHATNELRVRYWMNNERSAWILEEIGKEKPITTGIVIDKGKIERIKVLIYRESRGWEVRHEFFTDQFKGAQLQDDRELDHPIDNISGATLSVDALTRLARMALYLNHHVAP